MVSLYRELYIEEEEIDSAGQWPLLHYIKRAKKGERSWKYVFAPWGHKKVYFGESLLTSQAERGPFG